MFVSWVNWVFRQDILPTNQNDMPQWIPLVPVWVCLGFMWMQTVLGFCVGCKAHSLLVKLGMMDEACEACNNLNIKPNA